MAKTHSLPRTVKPMLATKGGRPFDSPDHIFQPKWNGVRVLAFVESGNHKLQTRNLRNITSQFPELAALSEVVTDGTVLDAELVCTDDDGKPSFSLMRQRISMFKRRIRGGPGNRSIPEWMRSSTACSKWRNEQTVDPGMPGIGIIRPTGT